MTDEIIVEQEIIAPKRVSGQDIGNPMPTYDFPTYKGTKSDADSWMRSKNKDYRRKRARQLLNSGRSEDKSLYAILARHNKRG